MTVNHNVEGDEEDCRLNICLEHNVVYADDLSRSCWRIGWIERVIIGADGQRRAATVRASKNGQTSTLDRLIQHLYLNYAMGAS